MGNQARIEQLNSFPSLVVKTDINTKLMTPYLRIIKLHLSPLWKLAVISKFTDFRNYLVMSTNKKYLDNIWKKSLLKKNPHQAWNLMSQI